MILIEVVKAKEPLQRLTTRRFTSYRVLRELVKLRKTVDAETEFYTEAEKRAVELYSEKEDVYKIQLGDFARGIQECGGDVSKMAGVISEILPKALNTVMKYVPQILDLIVSVVGSIGKAIVDNLPMIVTAVSQIIFTILNGLIAALPQIADGALQLGLALSLIHI